MEIENTLVLRPIAAGGKPYCNEVGFVIDNFNQAKVKAQLDRRGIASQPGAFGGWTLKDPNGLEIGIAGSA